MVKLDVSIVIPSYNEAENLGVIIPKLKDVLSQANVNYEILVIDTIDKTDNTDEICVKNDVSYIQREISNNYCDAVKTGIKYANGEKTLFMDADGSHSSEFVLELLKYKDDFDLVIASRYVDGGDSDNNFLLKFMSYTLNATYALVLNIDCKDISNSFKLYDTKMLKSLNLKCRNFDIIEEIIYKLSKNNPEFKIKELPYYFKNRKYGKTKRKLVLFILGYIFTLIKLRFSDF